MALRQYTRETKYELPPRRHNGGRLLAAHESCSTCGDKALEVTGETSVNVFTHAVAVAVPAHSGNGASGTTSSSGNTGTSGTISADVTTTANITNTASVTTTANVPTGTNVPNGANDPTGVDSACIIVDIPGAFVVADSASSARTSSLAAARVDGSIRASGATRRAVLVHVKGPLAFPIRRGGRVQQRGHAVVGRVSTSCLL